MSVSEILVKIANSEPVTPSEREFLRRESENIDRAAKLINSWVVPGTTIPFIRDLQTSNVRIDSGEIQLGSGTVGDGFSGVRIGYPAFEYDSEDWNIAGVNDDTLQVGIRASDGKFIAGNNEVVIDENGMSAGDGHILLGGSGIAILEGAGGQGFLSFYDETGAVPRFDIKVVSGGFVIQSEEVGAIIDLAPKMTDGSTPTFSVYEDLTLDNRMQVNLSNAAKGTLFSMDNEFGVFAQGGSGGHTYMYLNTTTNSPPAPAQSKGHIYIRGDKLIVQYDDGGTIRYKYLPLTGTSTTWTHTTSAP